MSFLWGSGRVHLSEAVCDRVSVRALPQHHNSNNDNDKHSYTSNSDSENTASGGSNVCWGVASLQAMKTLILNFSKISAVSIVHYSAFLKIWHPRNSGANFLTKSFILLHSTNNQSPLFKIEITKYTQTHNYSISILFNMTVFTFEHNYSKV